MFSNASSLFLPISSHISQVPFLHYFVYVFLLPFSRFPGFLLLGFLQFITCFGPEFLTFFVYVHIIWIVHFLFQTLSYALLVSFPRFVYLLLFQSFTFPTALCQKSICVASNIHFIDSLIGYISQMYMIIVFYYGVIY